MRDSDVLIIGGGAAGLVAAIAAARAGASVTLLEAGTRVGRKILESGNGRCNLTNTTVSPEAYNHPEFVRPILGMYSSDAIRTFFGDMGLLTRADEEGRVYPTTNAAGSVLEVLRLECAHAGVEVRCDFQVVRVSPDVGSDGFEVVSTGGDTLRAGAVVVATGGGTSLLAGMGHQWIDCSPVLGPIKTDVAPLRGLSGVRVRCAATLLTGVGVVRDSGTPIATERGELLFRDYGVSGIMVFDLSRYITNECHLSIDFFPDVPLDELQAMLAERCESLSWRSAETLFAGMLHDRVARAVLRAAGVDASAHADQVPTVQLAKLLKDFRVRVLGMADARQSQVTRGGADVAGFDPITMASHLVDGLFAAGEVLDVDGRSGGFNLHWAWASGIVAGQNAAHFAAGTPAAAPNANAAGARPIILDDPA